MSRSEAKIFRVDLTNAAWHVHSSTCWFRIPTAQMIRPLQRAMTEMDPQRSPPKSKHLHFTRS